jgi:hypothetical protein
VTEVVVALLIVPHDVPLQPAPERDQVTPLFWGSPVTAAVNACVPVPTSTLLLAGESVTPIAAAACVVADATFE